MSSAYDEQVEKLLAEYRDSLDQAADSRRRINEVAATASAPRQVVKITVGAQGQVTALDFPTNAYRNMPPKDLAKVIMATLEKARAEALSKVSEIALGGMFGGGAISAADALQGRFDPRSVLPKELELPEVVRAYLERGAGPTEESGNRV